MTPTWRHADEYRFTQLQRTCGWLRHGFHQRYHFRMAWPDQRVYDCQSVYYLQGPYLGTTWVYVSMVLAPNILLYIGAMRRVHSIFISEFFSPEDGDSMFHRNLRVYMASRPRIASSSSPPWEPKISHWSIQFLLFFTFYSILLFSLYMCSYVLFILFYCLYIYLHDLTLILIIVNGSYVTLIRVCITFLVHFIIVKIYFKILMIRISTTYKPVHKI
jgi:hypothetical protein